jgi:hypothetical protein
MDCSGASRKCDCCTLKLSASVRLAYSGVNARKPPFPALHLRPTSHHLPPSPPRILNKPPSPFTNNRCLL